jgi:hypothetical protein
MRLAFIDAQFGQAPVRDFWSLKNQQVPEGAGAYVLLAAPGVRFTYPRRDSSVFYIGQATNLRERLLQHVRYALEARQRRRRTLYYPRYEYAAEFGCRYTYVRCRPRQEPRVLEDVLLAAFAMRYRSWPVANGAGSWHEVPMTSSQSRGPVLRLR